MISHNLKKSCAIVLGGTTFGLLILCAGNYVSAKKFLLEDSAVIRCFRKGWESVNSLFKAHGVAADQATLLANYQYKDSEYKDIAAIHQSLIYEQLNVNLLKEIALKFQYSFSNVDMDPDYTDEISIKADVQLSIFEALMQRHANGH